MPIPIFAQVLLAVLFVGTVATALIFWNQILDWANKTLFPWIKKNLPWLANDVINAFVALDKVLTPMRIRIKEAWKKLREYLLKILVQFEQNTRNDWVKRITYWAIRNLESNEPEVARVVEEQIVDFDSLPPDVREEFLRRSNISQDVNVTQLRDRELELAPMTN
ncbi:hypothetical protein DP113_05635 [Brasilonema octagenarum UFV-E1]|uniref:Uncharacterized protein n=2 Tax=Brasilonema TaxID=383614 RepID=A0A856MES0_9CYAN|nr:MULTISPECIES: hypothetical protein [Brasilonema]NMF66130.1 hypothetical protein [Brasilonema octagenarum UFV-OR1]QDL07456.1 hypothetical protein DP114_05680 [Brasilonema sennae CENA114]QDL13818.1 hypothetical protein DP113_05635 [Brasilonema octagenarum UFV-E1]